MYSNIAQIKKDLLVYRYKMLGQNAFKKVAKIPQMVDNKGVFFIFLSSLQAEEDLFW